MGGKSAGVGGTPTFFLAGVGKVGWGDEDRWRESGEKEGGQRREDSAVAVPWCGGGAAPRLLTYPRLMGGVVLGSLEGRGAQDYSVVAVVGPRVCVVEQGVVSGGFDQRIGFGRKSGEDVSRSGSPLDRRIAGGNCPVT